ncbi:hypothetical protein [Schlesneria paludicola]|nr:hypothetical protein [Schlesneria paludicola]
MSPQPAVSERFMLTLVVILAVAALSLTMISPCFMLDNGLVYGGF